MENLKCPECDRLFVATRSSKVYCSRLCMRQAAGQRWRAANKDRLTAQQREYRRQVKRVRKDEG